MDVKESSGNVFEDIGCANSDEKLVKAELISVIHRAITKKNLTREQTGKLLGITQDKVIELEEGNFFGFSIENLLSFLRDLNQRVDIVVKNRKNNEQQFRAKYDDGNRENSVILFLLLWVLVVIVIVSA